MSANDKSYHGHFGLFLLLLMGLLTAGLVAVGVLYYHSYSDYYRSEVEDRLVSVANLKSDRLHEYRTEMFNNATEFTSNAVFAELTKRFVESKDVLAEKKLQTWMANTKNIYGYDAVMLLDTTFSKIITLSDRQEQPVSLVSETTLHQIQDGKVAFEDFYWNDYNNKIFLKVLAPILDPGNSDRLLAVVAIRIDPEAFLYPFLSTRLTESTTEETLFVRKDGPDALFLNSLRFIPDAALKLRVPLLKTNVAAVKAILGETGVVEGVDYRGVATVAAVRPVPNSPWFLVERMDESEILENLAGDKWRVAGFIGSLLMLVGLSAYWVWRRRSRVFDLALTAARREQELQEQRYASLFENMGVGVAVIDRDMNVVDVNRRMADWFPDSAADKSHRCYETLNFKPASSVCSDCPVSVTLSDGLMHIGETTKSGPDGERHYRIVATPLFDSSGAITAAIEVADDITAQRRTEKSLAERESVLAAITNSAQDAIVMMTSSGTISFWNPAAERIFGCTRERALGQNLHNLLAPARYHEAHLAAFPEFVLSGRGNAIGKTLELPALAPDGSEITVSLSRAGVQIGSEWHAVGILRDVTGQKRAEQDLHDALEHLTETNLMLETASQESRKMAMEAQAANIAKSQFLANMSHEIRTPMNGVIGMTGLLLDSDLSAEQRRYAEVVRSSGEALLDVINDILDFSKIEADKLELEFIEFDLRNSVEDAVELLALRAHGNKIEFICRIDPEVPTLLLGDPGCLRQVLINLGGNAIKFTPSGEVVLDVSLQSETDTQAMVRFEVRDTGIGIPSDKLGLLFTAFQQVDASTTRRFGGTGLGLAISKRIVERMGGQIGVSSQEGKGATFWFTIALAKQSALPTSGGASWGDIRGVRILAADDNSTNRLVIGEQLGSWGAEHVEVCSAALALEALRMACSEGRPFRILVTDLHMPDMDGESLGRVIKADPVLRDTLLVILTSVGHRGDAKRLKALGFSAYLTKPVRQSQLYDCLAKLIGDDTVARAEDKPIVTRHSLGDERRRNTKILLAEDHPTNQLVALRILGKLGYCADAVSNGLEAVNALRSQSYDIVLMDVQMPVMDGFEATRIIRSTTAGLSNPRIPIIAMTAHALKGDRELCLEQGMDDYVTKPIDPNLLMAALERWLGPIRQNSSGSRAEAGIVVFERDGLRKRLMGDDELVKEITAGFLDDMPKQIELLRNHVRNGNAAEAGNAGHAIKGAAANVGGVSFASTAQLVEKAAHAGDLEELANLLPELERRFMLLKEQMLEGDS